MVPLFAAVVRAVVILVPVLIPGATGKRGVVGEGNNGPVFADQLVACGDQPGRVEQIKHSWNAVRRHTGAGIMTSFFLRIHPVVHI